MDNRSLANMKMRSVAKTLLDEKLISTATAYEFLRVFFCSTHSDVLVPVERMLPVWLAVLMSKLDSEGLIFLIKYSFFFGISLFFDEFFVFLYLA